MWKHEKLVLDWRNKPKANADVRLTIEKAFDAGLPDAYDASICSVKCEAAYRHVYDAYYGGGASLYAAA
jgi:type I restriction enzyme R subunit